MNKNILAITIASLFAAASVNAVEIYNQNGATVEIYGETDIRYINTGGSDAAHQSYGKIDTADLGIKTTYDIANGFQVFGIWEINAEEEEIARGDLFAGVSHKKFGTITFGKQDTVLDDAGIGEDFEFGFDTEISNRDFSGEQVIKYQGDWDVFYAGASYMGNSNKGANAKETNGDYFYDANIGVRFAGIDARVFYGESKDSFNDDGVAQATQLDKVVIAEAVYTMPDVFDFGVYYSNVNAENAATGADVIKGDAMGFAANMYVNDWRFGLGSGWVVKDDKLSPDEDFNQSYANVMYNFSESLNVWSEVGYKLSEDEVDDGQFGLAVGIDYSF